VNRVKWRANIRVGEASDYKPEVDPIIKRRLISRAQKPLKKRFQIIGENNLKRITHAGQESKPAVIEEEIIRDGEPYREPIDDTYEEVDIDCLVSELENYGNEKYYDSAIGRVIVPKNAVYYEVDENDENEEGEQDE